MPADGLSRSTYYDRPVWAADYTAIVEALFAICDVFEFYGSLLPDEAE